MSQKRYFSIGIPISASSFTDVFSGLTTKGVLKGGELNFTADEGAPASGVINIAPIWLVFGSGVILNTTETVPLDIDCTTTNRNWTITCRHTDTGLVGGNAAVFDVELGLISNDDITDGIALGYVQYPAAGGAMLQRYISAVPQAIINSNIPVGSGDFCLPPFGVGFTLVSQTPASPVVTPIVSEHANYGTVYTITNNAGIDLTHLLKWNFVVGSLPPKALIVELFQQGDSTFTPTITDTSGTECNLGSPVTVAQSSGLSRLTFRITDGTFTSGYRYTVEASVLTQDTATSYIALLGVSNYGLPV